jgi:hypothetical protein
VITHADAGLARDVVAQLDRELQLDGVHRETDRLAGALRCGFQQFVPQRLDGLRQLDAFKIPAHRSPRTRTTRQMLGGE